MVPSSCSFSWHSSGSDVHKLLLPVFQIFPFYAQTNHHHKYHINILRGNCLKCCKPLVQACITFTSTWTCSRLVILLITYSDTISGYGAWIIKGAWVPGMGVIRVKWPEKIKTNMESTIGGQVTQQRKIHDANQIL